VPFLHGTFLFRRSCLSNGIDGYNESFPVAQDCDLMFRIGERWDIGAVVDVLYEHRVHDQRISSRRQTDQERFLRIAQQLAKRRRLENGYCKLGIRRKKCPGWLDEVDSGWLADRYQLWSVGESKSSLWRSFQFMIIAVMLAPFSKWTWLFIIQAATSKLGISVKSESMPL